MTDFSTLLKQNKASTSVAAVATTALAEESANVGISVASMEDMVAAYSPDNAELIQDEIWTRVTDRYEWYNDFSDYNISTVDELKNIQLDDNQINLSQEELSQFIPFEMPRRFDNFDLALKTRIQFHYVNSSKHEDYVNAVNVEYSDTKIRFALLVPYGMTYVAGNVDLEIIATGTNSKGENYKWISRHTSFNVEKSLSGNGIVNPTESDWYTQFVRDMDSKLAEAQKAANEAKKLASELQDGITDEVQNIVNENYYTKDEVDEAIKNVEVDLTGYATEDYVQEKIGEIPQPDLSPYALKEDIPVVPENVSEFINDAGYLTEHQSLEDYALKSEVPSIEGLASETYVREEIAKVDVSDQLVDYAKTSDVYKKDETYTKDEVDNAVKNVKVDLTGYATETFVNEKISPVNTAIATINETLEGIDKTPNAKYVTTYNQPFEVDGVQYTGENTLVVYEIYNKDTEDETRTVVSSHVITGGSGSSSANEIIIDRITNSPIVVTQDDKIVIEYKFTGTDSSGDDIGQGKATWKVGNRVVKTDSIYTGNNSVDLTEYIGVGSDQKVTLTISDDIGTIQQKIWYVSVVDVKLESDFNDTRTYEAGSSVTFTYTPKGAVDKTIHFLIDGKEIATKESLKSAAGLSDSYVISAKEHGSHLFEVYMTATINNNEIESNHIVKDIIWYDESATVPVIGCVQQNFTAKQYETTNIVYTVFDPSTETPTVEIAVDGVVVSTPTLTTNTDVYLYKTDIIGKHTITIKCGETVKTLIANIEDLGIEVSPTTAGLEFDFNPVGYSNNDVNKIWSDSNTGVTMSVSDNFDWVNGGYRIDDSGDQYFCVKAGTTATINYNLFANDAKVNGKEFKVIFKTTNVKNRNTSFISCMESGIGLDMKVESANIYSSNDSLYSPYCEDDVIEFEFNINKNTDIPMVMTYEDGVGNRPMIYTSDSSFWQTNPNPIVIGSNNCDVWVYRMKAYSTSLSDRDILNNFIADARSAEEMVKRYQRNQIYKEGVLDPEYLAEKCKDLRIILVDTPWFTNDKDNKIDDTNITMIYKNGDPILDNWTCTGARHRGQGTSSNEYGYSSRNIDLVMDTDTSLFTLGDGKTTSSTITLTRDSVPTDYLNVKVNVASSENANNAENARNYSLFNPFIRFARWKDSKVKDCMEFFNCVIFIRERDEDISTHREFQDTNWHFYSIGNVGDSKKTDDTRVNDKNDPKEHIVEITDYNVPLAEFPTGADGICPESEWKAGNKAYDFLYSEYEYEDGEFKAFGAGSYEFRYEMKKISEEQRQANIDTWRDMYKFVVTSSDEEFYSKLKEWFVVDSALYYYLFTERYTMVDNRAKNSFWHYGKVYISEQEATTLGENAGGYIIDNAQAAIRNGYRYDLTQGYDFDTSLGIDNTGKLVLTYGKEDTDFYVDGDSESGYIYRAAESTFFCRLRDLFASEMQAMFVDRENQNAWSSSRLIKQWDDAQSLFPEELWRLDIQRKYLRTYQGISIDNSFPGEANPRFLTTMMNGRKKYQRRMFERNQELYMATKYFGKVATQDQIMMRFNNPVGAQITPDFTLYITPYSDMYIGTSFGNVTPTNFRAKAGVEYTIPCSIESGTADITLIYGASFIQAIGDLSRCYVGDNDFSKASRLQSLVIGSNNNNYSNSFMTKIALGNNKLLEYLDIRNVAGLNSVVDLSQCSNLLELHAEGSGATGVIFANGGKLEKAYIPAVTSLTMKNLNYLEEFVVENYNKLQTLIVEYTPFIDTHEIVNISSALKTLRLIGIDWDIETTAILDRLLNLRGVNNTGGEINTSVLTGNVYVPGIKEYDLYKYQNTWSDLEVSYGAMTPQFVVTFVNDDGSVLDVQYVDMNHDAVDPINRENNPIATPTKESTVSTVYTFAGWDSGFTNIGNNKTIKAVYTEAVRKYSVKYVQKFGNSTTVLQSSDTVDYGTYYFYEGETPTYTSEESYNKFYLFNTWDKSGYVDGDKVITAIYDECYYSDNTYFKGKEFIDLSPVQLYALSKLIENGKISISQDASGFDYIEGTKMYAGDDYSFNMGHDYNYSDLEDKTYSFDGVFPRTFSGVSGDYYDTGIRLLEEDRDFVLAIDYEFDSTNVNGSSLVDCFEEGTSDGFRLAYDGNPSINWHESGQVCASKSDREMLVIRHKAGDKNLYVYASNLSGDNINRYELSATRTMNTNFSLIFGCGRRSASVYNYYAKGTIHWAKLWYADLGEHACEKLASYIHEEINLKVAGFYRQFLSSDSSTLVPISFIGSNVLYTQKNMSISSSKPTEGGWSTSYLNTWLNNRFYNGLPSQIKQLIKRVNVKSTAGNALTTTVTAPCYIYIPAISEIVNSSPYNAKPYTNEVDGVPVCIPFFTDETDCIRYDYNGVATDYWTRSPGVGYTNYFVYIQKNGAPTLYVTPTTKKGVVIEFSI